MFLGRYEHTIDEKGRLIIPARFRDLLAEGAYVTRGFDRNLIVLTESSFQRLFERSNQLSLTDTNARMLNRQMFSDAASVEFDKAGRILMPQYLRQFAGLDGPVVIVGVGAHVEIWSQQAWAEQSEQLNNVETNNQRFAALDLSVRS